MFTMYIHIVIVYQFITDVNAWTQCHIIKWHEYPIYYSMSDVLCYQRLLDYNMYNWVVLFNVEGNFTNGSDYGNYTGRYIQ